MSTLVLGREIVSDALRSGDARPYIGAGLTLDFMRDTAHPAYTSVFTGQDSDAWKEILRHHERFGKPPELSQFRLSYPECSYELSEGGYTAAELIDLARTAVNLYEAELGSGEAGRYIDAGDPRAAAEIMQETAETILRNGGSALPFRLLSLAELDRLPEPEPLIDGVLDQGTVTLLAGASGSGKSFVALDWALSVATGRPWLGREVKQGRALYLAAEGAYGMRQRVRAWRSAHSDIPDDVFALIPDAVQLSDASALACLAQAARDYDLIVIDTLARTASGLDENSARDMGVYIEALYKLRDAFEEAGTTVVCVHHSGYDTKRARGSSAIRANVDNVLMVQADPDPHELFFLRFDKRKDGPTHTADFSLQLMELESSCVVISVTPPCEPVSRAGSILAAISAGAETQNEIAMATALDQGSVSREVGRLVTSGRIVKKDGRPARYTVEESR